MDTDSLHCHVDVVDKLVVKPNVTLMNNSTILRNKNSTMLTYGLKNSDGGTLICNACVTVPIAEIKDYCDNSSVVIKGKGT